ncbi:MAG: hypothetical protein H6562_02515 [Lewinellaceae bacterium]|nr:hypothetical protein [Lewinella sp.]MCB9277767.1 hypothetical protein [Lewinellaceae bacterium]
MNNFQRLFEEDGDRYKNHHETIRQNLLGTLGVFRFVGQIVEVYIPRVADMIVSFSGGNAPEDTPLPPPHHEPPSSGAPMGPNDHGPVGTGDIR